MSVIETFFSNPGGYIVSFIVVLLVIKEGMTIVDWFCNRFGIETTNMKRRKKYDEMVSSVTKQATEFVNLTASVKSLNTKVDELDQKVDAMQEKNNESTRARIKDRIAQAYRYYNADERKCWTKMEKEAFDGLIKSYEIAGGTNSFIHDICQPASLTWQIVDKD